MRSKSIHHLHIVLITVLSVLVCSNTVFATQNVYDSAANTKLQNIYNYFTTSNWVSNQSNGSPRYTDLRGVMFDVTLMLLNIQSDQSATRTNTGQINNALGLLDQKVDAIYNNTDYVETHLANINSNTDYVETHLSNIYSSLENIGWTNRNITYSYHQTLSDAVSQSNALTSNLSSRHIYIRVNFTDWDPYNDALNLVFPIIPYFSDTVPKGQMYIDNIYGLSNAANSSVLVSSNDIYFAYNSYQRASTFYLDGIGRAYAGGGANQASRRTLIFDVTGTQNVYIFGTDIVTARSLPYGSEDYLKLANYIKLQSFDLDGIESNLQTLVDVYASPDVIAAKQQQQAYEDQAITDFTGSGNAAASTSDTTNMKNVSGAIKSGLDSGGSVNGALGVFNTSGGLWDWFSQSNYDEINGPQTRSRGSDEYIDFYSINRAELEELLGEYR